MIFDLDPYPQCYLAVPCYTDHSSVLSEPSDEQHASHYCCHHVTLEFPRWVEDLLSRDELPLVGSAVPAMTQPPPQRGNCHHAKCKTKAKKTTKMMTTLEEDKSTAPAAPVPEVGQVPAQAASSPEDSSPKDGKDRSERQATEDHGHQPDHRQAWQTS